MALTIMPATTETASPNEEPPAVEDAGRSSQTTSTEEAIRPHGAPVQALVIVNPQAGPGVGASAAPALDRLRRAGWQVDVCETTRRGHAAELARAAVTQGYHVVIGCGGDGTLNEVVQGLVGSEVALGIIPLGTANVLARELHIPLDPPGAANVLIAGRTRRIDVGLAGDRAFLMMAGIGLDAHVVEEVEAGPRRVPRLLKAPVLFLTTLRRVLTYPGTPMELTVNGQTVRGRVLMVVAGNIRSYAGVFQIAHAAVWDDGVLDLVVIFAGGLLVKLNSFLMILRRRSTDRRRIAYFRTREAHIVAAQPVPVQADGDLVGVTPMTISIRPVALRVVVPSGRPTA
jgi:YegS/Rv2252/BmrU family lipid kinase